VLRRVLVFTALNEEKEMRSETPEAVNALSEKYIEIPETETATPKTSA
jgi:hypothetical protein